MFADGFDSGDALAWSDVTTNGLLNILEDAQFHLTHGARIECGYPQPTYLEDLTPEAESRYRARFYLRNLHLDLVTDGGIELFSGYDAGGQVQFLLELREYFGQVKLHLYARDSGILVETNFPDDGTVDGGFRCIELDWMNGPGNGYLSVWMDGDSMPGLTNLSNNSSFIDSVKLGAIGGSAAAMSGQIDLDMFESWRTRDIGCFCFEVSEFWTSVATWPASCPVHTLILLLDHQCEE